MNLKDSVELDNRVRSLIGRKMYDKYAGYTYEEMANVHELARYRKQLLEAHDREREANEVRSWTKA